MLDILLTCFSLLKQRRSRAPSQATVTLKRKVSRDSEDDEDSDEDYEPESRPLSVKVIQKFLCFFLYALVNQL